METSMQSLSLQICNQISSVFSTTTNYPPALEVMLTEISAIASRKGRVFVHGVGREGLMLKALCMRLVHLGLSAHCVGDVTTPPISSLDLLVASSGPGGFSTVDAICEVARSHGARVLFITAQPESGSCDKYATAVAYIPAKTMADDQLNDGGDQIRARPLLLMGSVYEGAMFVLFEMVVFMLGEVLCESPEAIRSRHTNLEFVLQLTSGRRIILGQQSINSKLTIYDGLLWFTVSLRHKRDDYGFRLSLKMKELLR